MSAEQNEIKRKAAALRAHYGHGYLTCTQLSEELGMRRDAAARWAKQRGLGYNFGQRVRYDVDALAATLVKGRGNV